MTGTAATESPEFQNIYKLNVTVVPTNQTVRRTDESDVVFKTEEGILSWWKAFIFIPCHVSSLVHFSLYKVQNVVTGRPPCSLPETGIIATQTDVVRCSAVWTLCASSL